MLAASSIHAMAQVSTIQRVTTWCMQCTQMMDNFLSGRQFLCSVFLNSNFAAL
jgi:hypothetical protein